MIPIEFLVLVVLNAVSNLKHVFVLPATRKCATIQISDNLSNDKWIHENFSTLVDRQCEDWEQGMSRLGMGEQQRQLAAGGGKGAQLQQVSKANSVMAAAIATAVNKVTKADIEKVSQSVTH